jgi:hypothetical protein
MWTAYTVLVLPYCFSLLKVQYKEKLLLLRVRQDRYVALQTRNGITFTFATF